MREYDFIYFMGDSYTVGCDQGDDINREVTRQNRFSQLVADRFNLPLVNHAIGGCSNDYIARTVVKDMLNYKKEGKNPLVAVCYSHYDRREMWYKEQNRSLTLNPDMDIYKEYLVNHYNKEFNKDFTRYHMASIKHVLRYMQFDFVEAWSAEVVDDPLLDHSTEIFPDFVKTAGVEGCFILAPGDDPVLGLPRLGHLNVKGNKMIAELIIDKIVELYGKK